MIWEISLQCVEFEINSVIPMSLMMSLILQFVEWNLLNMPAFEGRSGLRMLFFYSWRFHLDFTQLEGYIVHISSPFSGKLRYNCHWHQMYGLYVSEYANTGTTVKLSFKSNASWQYGIHLNLAYVPVKSNDGSAVLRDLVWIFYNDYTYL